MSEILECVEAGNVQARRKEDEAREYARRDVEQTQAAAEYFARKKRKKAILRLGLRVGAALLIVAGLYLALCVGLIAWQLAVPFQLVALLWAAVDFGAWLQFDGTWEGRYK